MGQHYYHLSAFERNFIHRHLNLLRSQRWIAQQLERPVSCISREIRRNGGRAAYDAAGAGSIARRRRGLVKLRKGTALREHVFSHIRKGWSLQQICGNLKLMEEVEQVSHETIYRAIYILPRGEIRKEIIGLLRQGHKLPCPRTQGKDRRGIKNMVSIHDRDTSVL